jgi:hypothetical protein
MRFQLECRRAIAFAYWLMRRHGNGAGSGYGEPNGTASWAPMLRSVESTSRLTSTSDAVAITRFGWLCAAPACGFARTK